jgi:hypothetical protein
VWRGEGREVRTKRAGGEAYVDSRCLVRHDCRVVVP